MENLYEKESTNIGPSASPMILNIVSSNSIYNSHLCPFIHLHYLCSIFVCQMGDQLQRNHSFSRRAYERRDKSSSRIIHFELTYRKFGSKIKIKLTDSSATVTMEINYMVFILEIAIFVLYPETCEYSQQYRLNNCFLGKY